VQFLLDDAWVDTTHGATPALGRPEKVPGDLLPPSMPWESVELRPRHTLLFDDDIQRFRMWYTATSEEAGAARHRLCYAESSDGLNWERPELGLVEFDGSSANNIVCDVSDADGTQWQIVKDLSEPHRSRRYKSLGFDYCADPGEWDVEPGTMGLCVAFSPDGFRWTKPTMVFPTTMMTDSDCMLPRRDPISGLWTGFFRPRTHPKRRFIGLSTSDDFVHWSAPRMLLTPDREDEEWTEFYGVTADVCESVRVGILWVYHNNPQHSPMTTELVHSRNGIDYHRTAPREEFLARGSEGEPDEGMVRPIALTERDDHMLVFFSGTNREHGSDRGMEMQKPRVPTGQVERWQFRVARLPWGHFRGLRAHGSGLVETKWLTNYGTGGIRAVASLEQDGWVKAELLDQYGNTIPGFQAEDSHWEPAERGTLRFFWGEKRFTGAPGEAIEGGRNVGHVVKVRFHLHKATLFGFSVGE